MNKTIKIIYYKNKNNGEKNCLCAIKENNDLRTSVIITEIADKIKTAFETSHNLIAEHSIEIAKCIAHYESAQTYEYEFGVEEIDLID